MSSRIAEADAALLAGRFDEGVGLIEAYLRSPFKPMGKQMLIVARPRRD
ncbi:MAG TPA: hypothetical protein PKB04_11725 [Phenylobacterium sp.]|nr:hypothetical protein [Phenylobacterium sp.]